MNTNKFIYPASSLLLTSGLCFAQERDAVATTERPNVIYLLCDDMGYSDIEAYGQQMISTPNLNRLVNKGMSFTQFYASTAVSAPSRASLMTGQHTGHTKIRGNKEIQPEGQEPLDPNVETLGHLFQQNGYVTGCFGKWGMGYPGSGGEANKMGFDVFTDTTVSAKRTLTTRSICGTTKKRVSKRTLFARCHTRTCNEIHRRQQGQGIFRLFHIYDSPCRTVSAARQYRRYV